MPTRPEDRRPPRRRQGRVRLRLRGPQPQRPAALLKAAEPYDRAADALALPAGVVRLSDADAEGTSVQGPPVVAWLIGRQRRLDDLARDGTAPARLLPERVLPHPAPVRPAGTPPADVLDGRTDTDGHSQPGAGASGVSPCKGRSVA